MPQVRMEELVLKYNGFPLWKRIMDIIGAFSALVLLSPVFLIIALVVLITDGSPIMFRQPRVGWQGDTFYVWKFRSMCHNAEEVLRKNPEIYRQYIENDYKLPEGKDPRITKLGRFLRKTSLDELPQFWNVLKGDMSLVGPRPIVPSELEEYGSKKMLFLKMRPGITGVWQVSGRSDVKYPERAGLELSYLENQGLLFDVVIVLKTFYSVFRGTGAH